MKYELIGGKRRLIIEDESFEISTHNKSHIVYCVDSSDKEICYTKVGHAETSKGDDMLITLNPATAVTGQLLLCKKEL